MIFTIESIIDFKFDPTEPELAKLECFKGTLGTIYIPAINSLFFNDGTFYFGEQKDYLPNGHGLRILRSGDFQRGNFQFGKLHGEGQSVWKKNNEEFIGNFDNNKFDGFGEYKFSNGTKYIGNWKQNLFHGKGEFIFKNGSKFKGNYENDLRDGDGVIEISNNLFVKGYWSKGKKNSKFSLFKDGKIVSVEHWRDGIRIHE